MGEIEDNKLEKLKATGNLPTPRGVALEIIRLSQLESVHVAQITRVVQADPALSGRLLKAANSPALGGRRPVMRVADAIALLGVPPVRQLALGFSLVSNYRGGKCAAFDYQGFWSGSLVMALAAQALAARLRIAAPEEVFTGGLLARVGRLALATLYPVEYSRLLAQCDGRHGSELRRLEQLEFATDEVELTGALLMDWGLPRVLVSAIEAHPDPRQVNFAPGSRAARLAHQYHVASLLGELVLAPAAARGALLPPLLAEAASLDLDPDALRSLTDEVIGLWREWGSILEVPTGDPGNVFEVPPAAGLSDEALAPAPQEALAPMPHEALAPMPHEALAPVPHEALAPVPQAAPRPLRILVAGDDPALAPRVREILGDEGHGVAAVRNAREALARALVLDPNMLIIDWEALGAEAAQLCKALRGTPASRGMYILLLTDRREDERAIEALDARADDCLGKPISAPLLKARVHAVQRIVSERAELGREAESNRKLAADLAVSNRRLQQAAMSDALTGLPNRRYALERMEQEWAAAHRHAGPLSCVLLDVDGFKAINDRHGHDTGDAVLRHVAAVLRKNARVHELICRIGGEEFLVICPESGLDEAFRCAERLRSALAGTLPPGLGAPVTASIGVASNDTGAASAADLLKMADRAMYRAKAAGRNRSIRYEPEFA